MFFEFLFGFVLSCFGLLRGGVAVERHDDPGEEDFGDLGRHEPQHVTGRGRHDAHIARDVSAFDYVDVTELGGMAMLGRDVPDRTVDHKGTRDPRYRFGREVPDDRIGRTVSRGVQLRLRALRGSERRTREPERQIDDDILYLLNTRRFTIEFPRARAEFIAELVVQVDRRRQLVRMTTGLCFFQAIQPVFEEVEARRPKRRRSRADLVR